jgi:hypothetical protein
LSLRKQQSTRGKYIWRNMLEHVLIVERALGREIRRPIEIHHVDGNGRNNAHSNLVVCPNHSYHALIHSRTEALNECGNVNWSKCCFCKKWDAPENLAFWKRGSPSGTVIAHRECANSTLRAYKARNPEYVARHLAKRREKYAQNEEHRERIKTSQRKYNARQKQSS